MKLGVFDSGLGGLVIAKSIREALPHHDMIYLGDTLHVPYGNRSEDAVMQYTSRSMEFLMNEGCQLIIMACNTASAISLRHLQQNFLVQTYPDRRILGVVVPTLEQAIEKGYKRIGLLATERIVKSDIYKNELEKIDQSIKLFQKPAPLLVPAIEMNAQEWIGPLMKDYVHPLLEENIECLILGCTHYTLLKDAIKEEVGDNVAIMSQDELIPGKLVDYLNRHPEIDEKIGKNGNSDFCITDITDSYIVNAHRLFNHDINIRKVSI